MSGFNGLVEQFASRSLSGFLPQQVDPQLAFADKLLQLEVSKLTRTMVQDHKASCEDCKAKLSCADLDHVREERKALRRSIIPSGK